MTTLSGVLGGIATTSVAHTPALTFDRTQITTWNESGVDTTIGWEFQVTSDVMVSAIGVYDRPHPAPEPGLSVARQVGIWDLDMNLITTAVIDAGNDGNLCEDDYRFVPIPTAVLFAGQTYVVGVHWPGAPFDDYPALPESGILPEFHESISFVQTRKGAGAFAFPELVSQDTAGAGVVNFRVDALVCDQPEPGFVTLFESDNELAGNMFDLEAKDPDGLVVSSWLVNIADPVPLDTPVNVSVYWRFGSYEEASGTPDGWNELGNVDVFSRGPNRATPVPLGGLELPFAQTIGVYVLVTEYDISQPPEVPAMLYTNMPPAAAVYENDDVVLTGGIGKGSPPFTGFTVPNRMWNGGIVYGADLPGDVNGDGVVDVLDLTQVIVNYGPCNQQPCAGDIDGNGVVDVLDIVAVVVSWS